MIKTSAPGRICLFGEHQDYLGLPVIAMAINLRFYISYEPDEKIGPGKFLIHTPDLGVGDELLDVHSPEPRHNSDFCWGIAWALQEAGFQFNEGGRCTFHSEIPVRAGCSSSSAMSAAWLRLLIEIGQHQNKAWFTGSPELCAYLVYRGEKELFSGSGGMMDQYACSLGGLLHIFPGEKEIHGWKLPYSVEQLPRRLDSLVLIDSGVPKDTQGILKNVGENAREALQAASSLSSFNIRMTTLADFKRRCKESQADKLRPEHRQMVLDQLINRDLCRTALEIFRSGIDFELLGSMLNEEHRLLAETLKISTDRIDSLQKCTLGAGASGAKINGSGGGGTLFCYAPGALPEVKAALQKEKARFFEIEAAEGMRVH